MKHITASNIYYIKLGHSGEWENECLQEGTLRLGYRSADHEQCLAGKWDIVVEKMKDGGSDAGAATRHANQIRTFYEADEDSIFITFSGGLLYWCRPFGPVELLPDHSKKRKTSEWSNCSKKGIILSADRLSGHLLKVQMFRGTICKVQARDYLLQKLNDQLSPEAAAAEDAERALVIAIVGMMRRLKWQDFELLVDLVFSNSGWRRLNPVGGTQKTVDLELVLPSTGERAFVQIKSEADRAVLREYAKRLEDSDAHARMFFVWHTGDISEESDEKDIILLGPHKLARLALDAGLSSWLREKIS